MTQRFNITEAAAYLHVSVSAVRCYVNTGELPVIQYVKNGKLWFDKDTVDLFIQRKQTEHVRVGKPVPELTFSREDDAKFQVAIEQMSARRKTCIGYETTSDGFDNEEDAL